MKMPIGEKRNQERGTGVSSPALGVGEFWKFGKKGSQ